MLRKTFSFYFSLTMSKNSHVCLILILIFVTNIVCRFDDEYARNKGTKISNILANILMKKIQTDSLDKDDLAAIFYLTLNISQRKNALFATPPIYWYSRKGKK